jgi:hypothetical protein
VSREPVQRVVMWAKTGRIVCAGPEKSVSRDPAGKGGQGENRLELRVCVTQKSVAKEPGKKLTTGDYLEKIKLASLLHGKVLIPLAGLYGCDTS